MIQTTREIFFVVLLLGLASCAILASSSPEDASEQIRAENKLMKKRITGLERENSVLSQENQEVRRDLAAQKAKVQKLGQEMAAMKFQCEEDIVRLDSHLEELGASMVELDQQCSFQIQELTRSNREMESSWLAERKQWNDELAAQKGAFEKEREATKNERVRRERESNQQIDRLKKEVAGRDATIQSLQAAGQEQASRLEASDRELQARSARIQLLEKEIQDLKARLDIGVSPGQEFPRSSAP